MALIQDPRNGTSDQVVVDPTLKAVRVTPRPPEQTGGTFRMSQRSGTIAAATGAGIQFSFRYVGTGVCLVHQVRLGLNVLAAYTQGAIAFGLWATRNYTVSDLTGGTQSALGLNNKMRDQMANSQVISYICTTGLLTGGTGTDDPQSMAGMIFNLPATITGQPMQDFFSPTTHSFPLLLGLNEGFRVRSDTAYAATGTCNLVVNVEWTEYSSLGY